MKSLKNENVKKENGEVKKIYRIGDKIEVDELEKVAKGITIKALKVIETSGNRWASRIIEKQDLDTLEDLQQIVILKLIENEYIINRECYKVVNRYMYNYKVNNIRNIEIVVNDENNISNLDRKSYIEYIKEECDTLKNNIYSKKISIEMLQLTEKQKEILNIYSSLNSLQATADLLGVAKSTVQVTIERIREKTKKLCYSLEY